jgi:hypothetical protein
MLPSQVPAVILTLSWSKGKDPEELLPPQPLEPFNPHLFHFALALNPMMSSSNSGKNHLHRFLPQLSRSN